MSMNAMNAPGGALRCLLRPQLRHVPRSYWCERARVQAKGGQGGPPNLHATTVYASNVRLRPARPEKKTPEQ